MKTKMFFLAFSICIFAGSKAFTQDQGFKMHEMICLMPNGSPQFIGILSDAAGLAEYKRIFNTQKGNVIPINLRDHIALSSGQTIDMYAQPTISEGKAYRFLSNSLCSTCTTVPHLDINKDYFIATISNTGSRNFFEIFWSGSNMWVIKVFHLTGSWLINLTRNVEELEYF